MGSMALYLGSPGPSGLPGMVQGHLAYLAWSRATWHGMVYGYLAWRTTAVLVLYYGCPGPVTLSTVDLPVRYTRLTLDLGTLSRLDTCTRVTPSTTGCTRGARRG